jgi:SAM-dependent methyltransferase
MEAYQRDLAYIHDAGFTGYVRGLAPGVLALLRRHGARGGLVVDLGCGSGRWARMLNDSGYDVVGVDLSSEMIRLARRIAPRSRFVCGSLLDFDPPACDAVTSFGECFNYLFDRRRSGPAALDRLFRRVYRSLHPGGTFVFDIAEPSRMPVESPRRHWTEGDGWAVLVEASGDRRRGILTRRIVTFRRIGRRYRRSEEVHRVRRYSPADLEVSLASAGFTVTVVRRFGRFHLPAGIAGFVCSKPAHQG